jgi:hypothetical protein
MNPANKAKSIVHQLAYIAGFVDAQIDQTVTIPVSYPYFAPNNEKDKILDILDILLFENGWVMNMDENDKIKPIEWIKDSSLSFLYAFNEDNIIKQIQIEESQKEYTAVELAYYELNSKDNVRVYTADTSFSSEGGFEGYPVSAGFYWPIEANVTDRITNINTLVYQEYDDGGIKYATNEAIVKKIDYNYKAFSSDFSGIVATQSHVLSAHVDNLDLTFSSYGNKKARILYKNNQATAQNLYFMHIEATVIYKSTERTLTSGRTATDDQLDRYSSYFVFNSTAADKLAKNMVQMYGKGSTVYTFDSEIEVPEGVLVTLKTDDATDLLCFVMERTYTEETMLFRYKVKGYSHNVGVLIGETNVIKTEFVPPSSIPTTTTAVQTQVPVYTPSYKGRFSDNLPAITYEKDSCIVYSAVSGTRGIYQIVSGTWSKQTAPATELIANAWADICAVTASGMISGAPYGTPTDYTGTGVDFIRALGINTAFINNLFANFIKIGTGGSIYGGDRFNAAGTEIDTAADGFWQGANGTLKANLQSLFRSNVLIGTDAGINIQDSGVLSNYNTIIGDNAGKGTVSSVYHSNTLVGEKAGFALVTGSRNCFYGRESGVSTISGYENSFYGENSGYYNTYGYQNQFFGRFAGYRNTTGYRNTFVGIDAGYTNTTGSNNCFVGASAGYATSTGANNCFFGNAGTENTTGISNCNFGNSAGRFTTSGYRNSNFGHEAGEGAAMFGGAVNTSCFGYDAQITASNQVQLGDSATTTYVYGTVQNRSDVRDKADIEPSGLGLAFINKLRPVSYRVNYREDYYEKVDGKRVELPNDGSKKRSRKHYGLIAQEVKQTMDELGVDFGGYQDHSVKGGKDVLSLGYAEFISPMIKAIQELSARVESLEKQLKEAQDV